MQQKAIILITIIILASSCVTQRRCNKKFQPIVQTQSIDSISQNSNLKLIKTDSIYIHKHDSIFLYVKNDTVFYSVFKILYRDRIKQDTIIKTDSVLVLSKNNKIEIVEVNRLTAFQKFKNEAFWVLSGVILLVSAFKLSKIL